MLKMLPITLSINVRRYILESKIQDINLGSAMLHATSDDIECGMWGDV
jgi:hypothetical protein